MIYIIFILGTLLGSFYLLAALRLVKKEDIVFKRSHCDNCQNTLKWYELIPVLSYILLGGKCKNCKTKISILNPLIEVSTGLLFAYMYYTFGHSYEFYIGIILSGTFIMIALTDFKHFIILDEVVIASSVLILITQIIFLEINTVLINLLSGAILFLFMLGIKKLGDIIYKRESMGGGDIKFSFVIGLSVGALHAFFVLILSAFLALPTTAAAVIATKNKEVPYGPFLAGALLLVFLNYDKFTDLINYISA